MADVFISYKREEREDVVRIADALRALKLDVWFDARLTSGESFNQEIDREARSAGCILVCWSPGAIASDWVQAESLIGFNDRKLAACQVAGDHALQVPAPFNAIHANDLRDWSGEGDHLGWQAVVQRIGEKLDRPGLTDFAQATGVEPAKKRIAALEKFAQKYASDPLAELAWNEIERLELDEAQSRIAARKAEAAKKAAEEAARRKPAAADPREETLDRDAEQARAWALMGENASPAQLREFVHNWQAGPFVDLARERLARLDDDGPKKRKAGAVMVPLIALMALAGLGIGGALIDPFGWFAPSPDDESREFTPAQAGGTHASTLESGAPTPAHPDEGRDLAQDDEDPDLRRDEREIEDNAAWERAKTAGTVSAYKDYLSIDDYTRHRSDAQTAVNRYEAAVMRLQTALNAKGFDTGTADGTAGSGTRRAVQSFRSAVNYHVDSVDLAAIDAGPINAIVGEVEKYVIPDDDSQSGTHASTLESASTAGHVPPTTSSPNGEVGPGSRSASGMTDEYEVGSSFTDCTGCPEMVVLPSGSFMMGSNENAQEKPVHEVTIGYKFAVSKFEITWDEWDACVSAGGCDGSGPDSKGGDEGWGKMSRPVINVDWNDAQAYARWLSAKTGQTYRLMSEAEWEYAARAGTTTKYAFGESISTIQANYKRAVSSTAPVGQYSANRFGIFDMHGNVWEWTQDCWNDSYTGAPSTGAAWEEGNCSRRVFRGGSWNDLEQQTLRSTNRNRRGKSYRGVNVGFRVARVLEV